jgi:PTS system nitrogen regulatory IIA component
MKLASVLSEQSVFPKLACATKKQALKELAEQAEYLTGEDAGTIFSVLMEREHASATAVGDGVAIPHGRLERLPMTFALAATLEKPIEFGAADGLPVDIIVMLLSPLDGNTEHLKAMATVSRLLRDDQLCQALRAAQTPEALYGVLTHPKS